MIYDFYIHTYNDNPTYVLDWIAQYHPTSKAILISDGDGKDWNTPYFHKFEQRLKDKGPLWITRWWDIVKEYDSELIVKVDPDSILTRAFNVEFPVADFFGCMITNVLYDGSILSLLHGGCGQFLTRSLIDSWYSEVYKAFRARDCWYKNSLISVDMTLARLAMRTNITPVSWSEVAEGFNLTAAITHA